MSLTPDEMHAQTFIGPQSADTRLGDISQLHYQDADHCTPDDAARLYEEMRKNTEEHPNIVDALALANATAALCVPNAATINGVLPLVDASQPTSFADVYGKAVSALRNADRNLFGIGMNTWAARMLRSRPSVMALPARQDESDLLAARAANALMEYQKQWINIDNMLQRCANLVQQHGSVFVRVFFDTTKGKKLRAPVLDEMQMPVREADGSIAEQDMYDESGMPMYEGIIDAEVLSVNQCFLPRNCDDVERAQWCYIRRQMTWTDAFEIAKSSNNPEVRDKYERYIGTPTDQSIDVIEMFYKPTKRFPRGLYAILVDKNLNSNSPTALHVDVYPYECNTLPITVWHCQQVHNRYVGTSHLIRAAPMQRHLNSVQRAIASYVEQTKDNFLQVMDAPVAAAIDKMRTQGVAGGSRRIEVRVGKGERVQDKILQIEPPKLPETLLTEAEKAAEAIREMLGLQDEDAIASGSSAKAIAHAEAITSSTAASAAVSLQLFVERFWRIVLRLARQFYHTERIGKLVGPYGHPYSVAFNRAVLGDGADFYLEATSQNAQSRLASIEEAQAGMKASGAIDMQSQGLYGQNPLSGAQANGSVITSAKQELAAILKIGSPTRPIDRNLAAAICEEARGTASLLPAGDPTGAKLAEIAQQYGDPAMLAQIEAQRQGMQQQLEQYQAAQAAMQPKQKNAAVPQAPTLARNPTDTSVLTSG